MYFIYLYPNIILMYAVQIVSNTPYSVLSRRHNVGIRRCPSEGYIHGFQMDFKCGANLTLGTRIELCLHS